MSMQSVATLSDRSADAVETIRDPVVFEALEREWNALVRNEDDQFFYRHEFIQVWRRHFAPRAPLRVLTLRGRSGELQAVLPLIERRDTVYGIARRQLRGAANVHSCRVDLVARDPGAAAEVFLDHLLTEPDWDLLQLGDVPTEGGGGALVTAARRRGLPHGRWPSIRSPYLRLPEQPEALAAGLDRKFRYNLRRRRKRLQEKGAIELERVSGGERLATLLQAGLELEQTGWKGDRGSAINQSGDTRGFYIELAHTAARLGALSLYCLRLAGRPVAFHYALEYRGRYLLLKPAYDEGVAECSPGQLLTEAVMEDCIRRGLREFDFLGADMPWKQDWTRQTRPHEKLFIFRNTAVNRLLCRAKFR